MRSVVLVVLISNLFLFGEEIDSLIASKRDTVYVNIITRDTVHILKKPPTDTIYTRKEVPCASNEIPVETDTAKFLKNDSGFTRHHVYFHYDLASAFFALTISPLFSLSTEFSINRKNSVLVNYLYIKKRPSESDDDTFNDSKYSGYISQHDIGISYRHYTRPAKYSSYWETGADFLLRKTNYTNGWEDGNYINIGPPSDRATYKGWQLFLHHGHAFRGNNAVFSLAYGLAYNRVYGFDDEIVKEHIMYLSSGLQLDLEINFGLGIL